MEKKRETRSRTEKSIHRVDSVLRLWVSQQLPLILPVNTRNLNVREFWRFYSLPRGENDKEKSRLAIEGVPMYLQQKNWLLYPLFPLPCCFSSCLSCAELNDKKTNREFRSVYQECRKTTGYTKQKDPASSMEISVSHRSRLRKFLLHRLWQNIFLSVSEEQVFVNVREVASSVLCNFRKWVS